MFSIATFIRTIVYVSDNTSRSFLGKSNKVNNAIISIKSMYFVANLSA